MFFSTQPKKKAAKLLQQHEYLDLLNGGLKRYQPSDAETAGALTLAHEVWSSLQLGAWEEPRSNMLAWRNRKRGQIFIHIPTAIQGCFLIVVLSEVTATSEAYILVDVEAEYAHASITCPAFGLVGPTSVNEIFKSIPQLLGQAEPFAVIELRGGTYMQVYADEKGFHLEHQLVTVGNHYRCVDVVGPEVAVEALVSYAFGRYEWAYDHRWERIDL